LEFNFQEVAFADGSGFVLRLSDVNRLLETFDVFFGKFQCGLREQRRYKLLAYVESKRALRVRDLRGGNRGSVLCRREPMLAFLSALK
jgi:hypothetical protein